MITIGSIDALYEAM